MRESRRRWKLKHMEFLALLTWLLLGSSGMLLWPFVLATPGAGLAALGGLGGLAACVLFIMLGAPSWAGWTQLGMALLGFAGAALAGAWLCDERHASGSSAQEVQAATVGLQLPAFGTVAVMSLLIATQVTAAVV